MFSLLSAFLSKSSGYVIYVVLAASIAVSAYLGFRLLTVTEQVRDLESANQALQVSVANAQSTIVGLQAQYTSKTETITEINQLLSKCYSDKKRLASHNSIVDKNMSAISTVASENVPVKTEGATNVTLHQNTVGITYVNNLINDLNSMQHRN